MAQPRHAVEGPGTGPLLRPAQQLNTGPGATGGVQHAGIAQVLLAIKSAVQQQVALADHHCCVAPAGCWCYALHAARGHRPVSGQQGRAPCLVGTRPASMSWSSGWTYMAPSCGAAQSPAALRCCMQTQAICNAGHMQIRSNPTCSCSLCHLQLAMSSSQVSPRCCSSQ